MFNRIISIKVVRIFIFAGLFFIVFKLFAPTYLMYSISILENSLSTTTDKSNEILQSDVRLEHDIPGHLARFQESPLLGYGYDILWYSNASEEGGLSANDVPVTAALGMFGIVGIGLFMF